MQTLSALRIGRLYPQEIFLLEAESTSGPQCGLKDYVNDTIGNRTRDLPAGIAVPQPTATPHAPETVVILWIAVPYIVDCGTVYCGLRCRILWIALPYIVDCGTVYSGLRCRILYSGRQIKMPSWRQQTMPLWRQQTMPHCTLSKLRNTNCYHGDGS